MNWVTKSRRKIALIVLITLAVAGGVLNAITDGQVREGVSLTDEYLNFTSCVQTILWIIFSLISGFTLLLDPDPMVRWLEKIVPKKANRFSVCLLGSFILATLPLNAYSLTHNCIVLYALFVVK